MTFWIILFIFCALPFIMGGLSRCPHCHRYCTDEEECRKNREE